MVTAALLITPPSAAGTPHHPLPPASVSSGSVWGIAIMLDRGAHLLADAHNGFLPFARRRHHQRYRPRAIELGQHAADLYPLNHAHCVPLTMLSLAADYRTWGWIRTGIMSRTC
jgi:hypothetical protein